MMKAEERRQHILTYLQNQEEAVSASQLAAHFKVSRQIIVGDIAILRAAGEEINATPRGYLLQSDSRTGIIRQIACTHDGARTEEELQICVDNGCSVLDVIVEHPVYGQLVGTLDIHSRYDISQFCEAVRNADAHALSELTDGIHLHTLRCPSQAAYERVCKALTEVGLLLPESDT